jgi:hypothetical protein
MAVDLVLTLVSAGYLVKLLRVYTPVTSVFILCLQLAINKG